MSNLENNKEEFIALCKSVKRDGMDNLIQWLEEGDFFTAPASSRYHGSYKGGLLEHSLNVYKELKRLLTAYPEIEVSEDSTIICSLFHDFCKINMYNTEKRNRKNSEGRWETYDAYVINEKFNFGGHGGKSVYLIQHFIDLTPEEAAAINCHMSCWDGNNPSVSNAYKQFPLAWLIHVADESATFIVENDK